MANLADVAGEVSISEKTTPLRGYDKAKLEGAEDGLPVRENARPAAVADQRATGVAGLGGVARSWTGRVHGARACGVLETWPQPLNRAKEGF